MSLCKLGFWCSQNACARSPSRSVSHTPSSRRSCTSALSLSPPEPSRIKRGPATERPGGDANRARVYNCTLIARCACASSAGQAGTRTSWRARGTCERAAGARQTRRTSMLTILPPGPRTKVNSNGTLRRLENKSNFRAGDTLGVRFGHGVRVVAGSVLQALE